VRPIRSTASRKWRLIFGSPPRPSPSFSPLSPPVRRAHAARGARTHRLKFPLSSLLAIKPNRPASSTYKPPHLNGEKLNATPTLSPSLCVSDKRRFSSRAALSYERSSLLARPLSRSDSSLSTHTYPHTHCFSLPSLSRLVSSSLPVITHLFCSASSSSFENFVSVHSPHLSLSGWRAGLASRKGEAVK